MSHMFVTSWQFLVQFRDVVSTLEAPDRSSTPHRCCGSTGVSLTAMTLSHSSIGTDLAASEVLGRIVGHIAGRVAERVLQSTTTDVRQTLLQLLNILLV